MIALALLALAPVQAHPAQPPAGIHIRLDVSPAGQTVLKKYLGAPDPYATQRTQRLRANAQAVAALANAPRLDLGRVEALMREQEALQGEIKRRTDDRTLAMLRELSEADRIKFVRSFRDAQTMAKPPGVR